MKKNSSSAVQFIVSVVIPSVILLGLSGEARLGPAKAMVLALLFPIAYELYSLSRRRKPSMLSLFAILGIAITGAISLLGLNEDWLAVRRSAIYFVGAVVLAGSVLLKHPLIDMGLSYVLDMDLVRTKITKPSEAKKLQRHIAISTYALIALLFLIGLSSYILTLVCITAATDTAQFNSEYVRLRVISLPATTLPLFVGLIAILMYLLTSIEKLTGLTAEELIRKRKS